MVANEIAEEAGDRLTAYWRSSLRREYTSRNHFRTIADEDIDRMATAAIRNYFPDHGIHSEEGGTKHADSPWQWIVDSVDGTINLWSHFTDHVAFCISLAYEGTPVIGIVNAAVRGEYYCAYENGGAYCNGTPILVAETADMSQTLMCTDAGKHDRLANIPYLQKAHGENGVTISMSTGCASVPLALVASGVLHAYLATSLEPEDMAASVVLIREAGGVVTNLSGHPWNVGDASILAANPVLHAELCKLFEIA